MNSDHEIYTSRCSIVRIGLHRQFTAQEMMGYLFTSVIHAGIIKYGMEIFGFWLVHYEFQEKTKQRFWVHGFSAMNF